MQLRMRNFYLTANTALKRMRCKWGAAEHNRQPRIVSLHGRSPHPRSGLFWKSPGVTSYSIWIAGDKGELGEIR